jgi:cation transport ATPase
MAAFPTEYMRQWVVYFSMVLDWRNYPFSIQTMVGWCYLFSMIFSVVIFAIGILLLVKKARPAYSKKIPAIAAVATLGAFLIFSAVVNSIAAAQEGLRPTFFFIFYIFTQLLAAGALTLALIMTQSKKQIIQGINQTKHHAFWFDLSI